MKGDDSKKKKKSIFYCLNIYRSSVARNSMNNILKKIPRGRREKIKAEEDQKLQNTVKNELDTNCISLANNSHCP